MMRVEEEHILAEEEHVDTEERKIMSDIRMRTAEDIEGCVLFMDRMERAFLWYTRVRRVPQRVQAANCSSGVDRHHCEDVDLLNWNETKTGVRCWDGAM
jgi:hypothetical protein